MTSTVRALDVRRRAMARVGVLAALLIVAGALPWLGGGSLAVRLIGLPLLVAGLLVGLLGYRMRHAPLRVPYPGAAEGTGGCGGCACGADGCCAGPEC